MSDITDGVILPSREYYYLELLGCDDGSYEVGTQTQWVGFESTKPMVELREASTVVPERVVKVFAELGLPLDIVNTLDGAGRLIGFGGFALVEKSLAEKAFPQWLRAEQVLPHGSLGFASVPAGRKELERRAPTPKMRMKVLKRDQLRCRICGRSADSSSDIELHVHHIRPVGKGGATIESNLVTLCRTCHNGLDPHYDLSLYKLIGVDKYADTHKWKLDKLKGMIQYRTNVLANTVEGG